jgi:hypothetical protein
MTGEPRIIPQATSVVTVAGAPEDAAWNRLLMLAAQAKGNSTVQGPKHACDTNDPTWCGDTLTIAFHDPKSRIALITNIHNGKIEREVCQTTGENSMVCWDWDDGHLEQWENGKRTKTGSYEPGMLEQSRQMIDALAAMPAKPLKGE